MSLKCEFCDRKFSTNASLYIHKQTQHKTPKIILVDHEHEKSNKKDDYDPQLDDELQIIDEFKKRKRKRKNDSDNYDSKKKKNSGENDNGLEIIDEYNDENDDDLQTIDEIENDSQNDDNLEIIDEVDSDNQDDQNLKVIDTNDRPKRKTHLDYKKLYEKCMKKSNMLKAKIKRISEISYKNRKNEKIKLQKDFDEKLSKFKKIHEQQMSDLEKLKDSESNDKLRYSQQKYQDDINQLQMTHKTEMDALESECEDKIKKLSDHIKSLQVNDSSLNSLMKAIFNCTSMEEIFLIQKLIKNHQIDVVVKNHLQTLQNILLSLSFGILPICQPQRQKISEQQRHLVEKINASSGHTVKRLIKNSRQDVINLFEIISDSIKLIRNSYNRHGLDDNI